MTAMPAASASSTAASSCCPATAANCAARTCCCPPSKRRKLGATPFAIRFHLGAGVEVVADRRRAWPRCCGCRAGALWQFRCRGGALAIEDSLWIDGDGRPHATAAARRHRRSAGGRRECQLGLEARGLTGHRGAVAAICRESPMTEITIKRALLSVSDKTGIVDLGQALARHGVELVSTGGTAKALRDAGLDGARHFRPHRLSRDDGRPRQDAAPQGPWRPARGARRSRRMSRRWPSTTSARSIWSWSISIPSPQTVAKGAERDEIIENIDIGGPSMVRSAAKNHAYVAIVTDPADYALVAERRATARLARLASGSPPRPMPRPPPMTR